DVEHSVEHVDKRDVADNDSEKIWAHVGDGAHQQAAGAAAFDNQAIRRSITLRDELFGGGDEIGEGVAFVMHSAGVVPGLAEFAATADVGDSEGHATIEKAEAIRVEANRDGDAVAAIAVQQKRSGIVTRCVAVRNE